MLGIYNFGYSVVNRELPHHPSWNINQSDEKGGKARCLLYYQHNLKLGIEAVNLKNDSWGILEKIEAAKMGVRKVQETYTVLHMFRQVLFRAGNQGNHQNFEKSLLTNKL